MCLTRYAPRVLPLLAALPSLWACTGPDDTGTKPPRDSDADTDTDTDADALRVPAEWEPQDAIWIQWPQVWEETYEAGISGIVAAVLDHEDVHILVNDSRTRDSAEQALADEGGLSSGVIGGSPTSAGFKITWHDIPNDNAWMRDNGPAYVFQGGQLRIQDWGFDAWGGAFGNDVLYRSDDAVPIALGDYLGLPVDTVDMVHERGDLEFNGKDTVILNWTVIGDDGRNPGITKDEVRASMAANFGVTRIVMIEGAPEGDLTGGHIDGIARFIDEDRVVVADCSSGSACEPGGHDDLIYDAAAADLEAAGLTVVRWPFAGKVSYRGVNFDTDYMNWLVGNGFVVAVGFDNPATDDPAKAQLEAWFPGREVTVIPMLESWYAGGGVHCHTNDQPSAP